MKKMLVLTLPLALAIAACDDEHDVSPAEQVALAEEEAEETAAPSHDATRWGPEAILQKHDADGDGTISKAEAEGHRLSRRFDALDADGDGKLTLGELKAGKHRMKRFGKKGVHHDSQARARWMLEKRDADGDGVLSRAEVEGSRLAERFDALDKDGDGRLTPDELSAMKGHKSKGKHGKHKDPEARARWMFEKLDADRDGVLTAAEVAGHRIADHFEAIDQSGDGKVTLQEAAAWKASHGKHREGRGAPRGHAGAPERVAG